MLDPVVGAWKSLSARLAGEDGFTVVEMVVTMALFLVVLGLPMAWMIVTIRQQNAAVSRSWSATQAEVGLERLTRDLRQVVPSTTTTFTWSGTAASVTLTEPQSGTGGATNQTVTWSCTFGSAGTCTRAVNSGSAVTEIRNVEQLSFTPKDSSGNSLTSPASAAIYAGITLQVQDTSALDHNQTQAVRTTVTPAPIVLSDGVDLRNNSY